MQVPYTSSEIILEKQYARLSNGRQFYPIDENGDEFLTDDGKLIVIDGIIVHPKRADGTQIIHVGADENRGHEDDNEVSFLERREISYPKKSNGDDILPVDSYGNEYYFTFIDVAKPSTIPNRYARTKDGDEIYPLRKTSDQNESQYMINNKYAVRVNKKPYYPKDGFKNEYYRIADSEYTVVQTILERYAVTNDGKIILPQFGDRHYIDSNKEPKVAGENIIGNLIRDDGKILDYLTDVSDNMFIPLYMKSYSFRDLVSHVKHSVTPVTPKQCDLKVTFLEVLKESLPFYQRWYFWACLVAILIAKVFLVWKFFMKPIQTNVSVSNV